MSDPALRAAPSGAPVVECHDLVVRYGGRTAVDGLSLEAHRGQVVALLGPNGAGKTSTVETLEGYRRPDAGTVRVLGLDPAADRARVVARTGVMLQRGGVYPVMGARQALGLFSAYYDEPEDPDALLDLVGLAGVARTPWRRLSGGEQQRLSLALALVGRPEVVFLDEPTAGVDPEGRLAVRRVITDLRDRGAGVVLTTHELGEAERLADDVVIIAAGRAVARGSVAELSAAGGEGGIRFEAPPGLDTGGLDAALGSGAGAVAEAPPGHYRVVGPADPARLAAVAAFLAEHELPLTELRAGHRSLEEIYLRVVGSSADPYGAPGRGRPAVGAALPPPGAAPTMRTATRPGRATVRRLAAQSGAELSMTMRRGESLLLTLGIPVLLLVFFSEVHLLPTGTDQPVRFLAPGILALAVMSTAFVNLSIATGFERGYGVLKRLGATPLGRPALLGAKIVAVLVVELVQAAVLVPVAIGLGWRPTAGGAGVAVAVVILATVGFGGLGLVLAGVLRAEVNLAAANGLWLVLLLVSGMLAPLSKLPGALQALAKALPAAALADALHAALGARAAVPGWAWVVLACWALGAPALAAVTFRWE